MKMTAVVLLALTLLPGPSPPGGQQAEVQKGTEAAVGLRARADRGDADAQYEQGATFALSGSFAEAATWYERAAGQGHARAQYALGQLYHSGRGVAQNYAEAVAWWRKSAEQGYATAQSQLSVSLALGEGAAVDLVEALKWLNVVMSREGGGRAFEESRAALEKKMTPGQVAEAQKQAEAWIKAFESKSRK